MFLKETVKIKGQITALSAAGLKVKINQLAECGNCNNCSGPEGKIITLPFKEGFKKDENVQVVIPSSFLSGISFLLYFIPALSLLAGFAGGYFIGGNFTAVFTGIAALGVSFAAVKLITKNRFKNLIDISHLKR